jgi:inositol phosphorylceramide mannosyltransferase catalytic subunit
MKMRFHALYHVLGIACLVIYVLYRLSSVLKTLLEDTTPYVLSKDALSTSNGSHLIPKILHQVYLGWDNKPMPEHWKEPQKSCIDFHLGWDYKFWTNDTAYNLLVEEYPWFLDTWNNYKYPIQRADSIRYFILERYGGIYIDLDNGCARELTSLLAYPAWMPGTTNRLGLTQHIMGSVPHHRYFRMLIDSLDSYNSNWLMPYLTIMNSAGPHFVSMVWSTYLSEVEHADVRILAQEEYAGNEWSLFTKEEGGTWHHWDTSFFKWVGHHIVFFVTSCFLSLCAGSTALWWLLCMAFGRWRPRQSFAHMEGAYVGEGPSFGKAD